MIMDLYVHRVGDKSVMVSRAENLDVMFEVPKRTTKWTKPPAPGAFVTAAISELPAKAIIEPPKLPKLLPPISKVAKTAKRKVHAESFRDRVLAAEHIRDGNLKDTIAKLNWRHWEAIRRSAVGSMDRTSIEMQLLTARRVLEMLVSRKALTANKMRSVAASYLRKMDAPPANLRQDNDDLLTKPFTPYVVVLDDPKRTEMVLRDCPTVWWVQGCLIVDLGYDMQTGELVCIRVGGDVSTKPECLSPQVRLYPFRVNKPETMDDMDA